jgi:hypothetical protein
MSPLSETKFDKRPSTRQPVPTFSLRYVVVTACLQSMAKLYSTVQGLGTERSQSPAEYSDVQACWCRLWVSSRYALLSPQLHMIGRWMAGPLSDRSRPSAWPRSGTDVNPRCRPVRSNLPSRLVAASAATAGIHDDQDDDDDNYHQKRDYHEPAGAAPRSHLPSAECRHGVPSCALHGLR